MTAVLTLLEHDRRGPLRPRSHMRRALAALLVLPLASCGAFGPGLAGLPSSSGWAPLPLRDWLIESEFRPHTLVICRGESCAAPAMVAMFEARGAKAKAYASLIAHDPARLIQQPARTEKPAPPKTAKPATKPTHPGSTTSTERLALDGVNGIRITMRSKSADGREASAVILQQRQGERLTIVLAVTADGAKALAYARAAINGVHLLGP